jgi:dienelactone hydrolase
MLASTCFGTSDEGRAFRGNPGQAGGVAKTGLKAAGVKHEIYRYDSAHAFANERSAAYDVACANQAWERMSAFLRTQIA